MKVAVLDHGSGNTHSVTRALARAGADVCLTRDMDEVLAADGLVVPGVGAFDSVMTKLTEVRGDRMIERRLAGGRPVLGICVGLQILFDSSAEHESTKAGLSQLPGRVERLDHPVLPHMGWSKVRPAPGSRLLAGLEEERFYFVHSYGVLTDPAAELTCEQLTPPSISWSDHGAPFVAAIEHGPLSATQFHPEKSGEAGMTLLTNWINTLG